MPSRATRLSTVLRDDVRARLRLLQMEVVSLGLSKHPEQPDSELCKAFTMHRSVVVRMSEADEGASSSAFTFADKRAEGSNSAPHPY